MRVVAPHFGRTRSYTAKYLFSGTMLRMPNEAGDDDVSTLLGPSVERPSTTTATFAVEVVEGPDRGMALTLDAARPSRILVGQSGACDLRLTDRLVSRRHVALEVMGAQVKLVDLGSTNRTHVNDVIVGEAYLRGGETIRIGQTVLSVRLVAPAARVALPTAVRFGRAFGSSAEMRKLYPLCERLAAVDVPIVIEGDTGTGKELLAEALHEASPRAQRPFVVFDCTALPPNLIDSALFGHERGAFTGALESRTGAFEQADGGTLLIDEIGELDPSLQPKLLRALERSEVQRLGSNRWRRVDVRIIAATRRDLDREVQAGRFREDLFFRLAVARIELPPLRERHGDIGLLTRHFWRKLGGKLPVPAAMVARFEDYAWPGNVRELRNAVARRIALGELVDDDFVAASQRPEAPSRGADLVERILALDLPLPRARQRIVEDFERRYVERVLAKYDGNVTRAAAASGIARRYFYTLRARRGY
jgi:DNA-binding NtrC family response regulator